MHQSPENIVIHNLKQHKAMQNKVIKLTEFYRDENETLKYTPILIGVDSIISVRREKSRRYGSWERDIALEITRIESRAAMVTSFEVTESVEEVWELINKGI